RIATALNLPLAELLAEDTRDAVELTLTTQFLKRLPRQTLAAVRSQLVRDYGSARDERMKRIALIGLRGAGKSTLGAKLAKTLGAPFIELDREIEREAGTGLSEIFLLYGQAGYRRYERRCLAHIGESHGRSSRSSSLPFPRHLRHASGALQPLAPRVRRSGGDARDGCGRGQGPEARLQAQAQFLRSRRRHRACGCVEPHPLRTSRGEVPGDHQRSRAHVLLGRQHLHARAIHPR